MCVCVCPVDVRESQSLGPIANLGAGVDGGCDAGAGVATGDKSWNLTILFTVLCGVACWPAFGVRLTVSLIPWCAVASQEKTYLAVATQCRKGLR